VQVHDLRRARRRRQRVAVNLPASARPAGARRRARRAGHYPVSWRLDVVLEELEPIPPAGTVHLGTSDVSARVVRSGRFAQLAYASRWSPPAAIA
jgi:hypothetical protein